MLKSDHSSKNKFQNKNLKSDHSSAWDFARVWEALEKRPRESEEGAEGGHGGMAMVPARQHGGMAIASTPAMVAASVLLSTWIGSSAVEKGSFCNVDWRRGDLPAASSCTKAASFCNL